jgi:hypothetical protein
MLGSSDSIAIDLDMPNVFLFATEIGHNIRKKDSSVLCPQLIDFQLVKEYPAF